MAKAPTALDNEIRRIEGDLAFETPGSKEYKKLLAQLETLQNLNEKPKKFEVSGDTLVLAGINLLGIVMILKHENLHVISTKALGFVSKLRL